MNVIITKGIVLARVNYQEADRILTVLSEDQGKLRLIAKGVRKERSKMAGGVELFSVSELSFIKGRGEISTLVSSRLIKYFDAIVKDINRTMYGYSFLKLMNKITEDNAEAEYFQLAERVLEALNTSGIELALVMLWADMRILGATGHTPNLATDTSGKKLDASKKYEFEHSEMGFSEHPNGPYQSGHIKLLRLAATTEISKLNLVEGIKPYIEACHHLTQTMRKTILYT